jgi:membrane protein
MKNNADANESKATPAFPQSARRRARRWTALVARLAWRRMNGHDSLTVAASLSYSTVFALVPALVLAFLVLKSAGVVEDGKRGLRSVLEAGGLTQIVVRSEEPASASRPADTSPPEKPAAPAADSGPVADSAPQPASASQPERKTPAVEARPVFNLAEQIESAVDSVEKKITFARLGPIGMVLLAWSAISLLSTIEQSLNRIFDAPRSRPLLARVLLYWSGITFLPIVGLALGFLAAKAAQFASSQAALAPLMVVVDVLANLAIGVLILACVYRFLPNTRVRFRSAIVGAAVVVPLWTAARWGFSLYVSQFVAKGSVYGALGLLPLFLVWVNFSWCALLVGGEIAHVVSHWRRLEAENGAARLPLGGAETLSAALAVGGTFLARGRAAMFAEVAESLGLPAPAVRTLLERLQRGGIVAAVPSGQLTAAGQTAPTAEKSRFEAADAYVPARPLEAIHAAEVLALGAPGEESRTQEKVAEALRHVRDKTRQALGEATLADLLRDTSCLRSASAS